MFTLASDVVPHHREVLLLFKHFCHGNPSYHYLPFLHTYIWTLVSQISSTIFRIFVLEIKGSDVSVANTSYHWGQLVFPEEMSTRCCWSDVCPGALLPIQPSHQVPLFPATAANNICEWSSFPYAAWAMLLATGHFTTKSHMRIIWLPVLSQSTQLMCHVKPFLTFKAPTDLSLQFRMAEKCRGKV